MITTNLEREYVTRILLFEVNSVRKSLISAFTLKKNVTVDLWKRYKQISSGSTNHYYFDDIFRYSIKTWESWANFKKFQSISILVIPYNRRKEGVWGQKYMRLAKEKHFTSGRESILFSVDLVNISQWESLYCTYK